MKQCLERTTNTRLGNKRFSGTTIIICHHIIRIDTLSVGEFHITCHILSWASRGAANSLSHVHNMDNSHSQCQADGMINPTQSIISYHISCTLNSVTWCYFNERCVLDRKYFRYVHNINTTEFTIFLVYPIKWVKFHLCSSIITKVRLSVYVI